MSEVAPSRRRPLWKRLWPLWVVVVLFAASYFTAQRRLHPSWDWAGAPVPQGTLPKVISRTIEANPSNLSSILSQVQPGDLVLLADGEYSLPKPHQPPRPNALGAVPSTVGMFVLTRSGIKGRPVTIQAKGTSARLTTGLAVEDAAWVVIDGLTLSNASEVPMLADRCSHVTLRNLTVGSTDCIRGIQVSDSSYAIVEHSEVFGGAKGTGIAILSDANCVVRDNYVHDFGSSGIALDLYGGKTVTVSHILVERNRVTRCGSVGGSALNCSATLDSLVRNNVLYKNLAGGIAFSWLWGNPTFMERVRAMITSTHLAPSSARDAIVGNTVFFEAGKGRSSLCIIENRPSIYARGNIFYGGLGGVVYSECASTDGLDIDGNVLSTYEGQTAIGNHYPDDPPSVPSFTFEWWRARGFDRHSKFGVDPLFVSIANDDYRLRPGSPAIDAGADLGGRCPSDMAGVKRPQGKGYDCGAYEFLPPGDAQARERDGAHP
jgi:hypothetical protein